MSTVPELTPERIQEIKLLLVIAGVFAVFVFAPVVAHWLIERRKRRRIE